MVLTEKEDISNKTVLVLALLVVLVVAGSSWLILNKLNAVEHSQKEQQVIEKNVEIRTDYVQPEMGGSVSFSILPQPNEGEQ